MSKKLPTLRKQKINKMHKRNMIKLKGIYIPPIGIGMIRNYIYIRTWFSGLILEVKM